MQLKQRYIVDNHLVNSNGLEAQQMELEVVAAVSDVAQESANAVLRGMFGMPVSNHHIFCLSVWLIPWI